MLKNKLIPYMIRNPYTNQGPKKLDPQIQI